MLSVAMVVALWRGRWQLLVSGFKQAGLSVKSVWFRLLLGFSLGGLIQILIPSHIVAQWLGPASGLKGIIIGAYAGIVMVGGPYVTIPVITSIYAAGASPGSIIALLTSMSLISVPNLLTWTIPFLGAKLSLSRYVVCLVISPIIGFVGATAYQLLVR